jgi:hypothetical protein
MSIVTVLEKLYGSGSPEKFEKLYLDLVSGLKVHLSFAGTTNRGWIQLKLMGEDKAAALSLLDREVSLAPVSIDKLKKFSVMKGKVVFPKVSKDGLHVDVGILSIKNCNAVISKKRLCAQLADGNDIPLQKLVELFCLYENLPFEIKIDDVGKGRKNMEAGLSEAQCSLFSGWIGCSFDRLIVLGAHFSDITRAIKLSKHYRDIIKVESLGFLEHVIICKLGTDAVGLIPKLGRYLKSAVLVPFSPKKIIKTVGSTCTSY